jgi:nitrite reductase (NADH) small subunit
MTEPSQSPTEGFVTVAEASFLPAGNGRTVNVRGREFALYNIDGEFYAIDDRCPHKDASLGAGSCAGSMVFCPLHAWVFDVKTGACLNRPDKPVQTYKTRVVDGWVQILIN